MQYTLHALRQQKREFIWTPLHMPLVLLVISRNQADGMIKGKPATIDKENAWLYRSLSQKGDA